MAGLGTRQPRHRQARRRALRRDPERADQQAGKLDRIATNAPNPVTSHIPRWSLSRQIEQTPDKTVRSQNHNNDTEVENPMTRAHDATAAAITHTAAQLLARHQNPTVGAVAQATGVARGTVYRYFPTRQALLTAVLDQALLQADHHLTRPTLRPWRLPSWSTTCWCWCAIGTQWAGHLGLLPGGGAAGSRVPNR